MKDKVPSVQKIRTEKIMKEMGAGLAIIGVAYIISFFIRYFFMVFEDRPPQDILDWMFGYILVGGVIIGCSILVDLYKFLRNRYLIGD